MDRNIHLDFNASTSKYVWKTAFKMAGKRGSPSRRRRNQVSPMKEVA
jgi:hypothetical protein